jgi:hypothetical protein
MSLPFFSLFLNMKEVCFLLIEENRREELIGYLDQSGFWNSSMDDLARGKSNIFKIPYGVLFNCDEKDHNYLMQTGFLDWATTDFIPTTFKYTNKFLLHKYVNGIVYLLETNDNSNNYLSIDFNEVKRIFISKVTCIIERLETKDYYIGIRQHTFIPLDNKLNSGLIMEAINKELVEHTDFRKDVIEILERGYLGGYPKKVLSEFCGLQ